MFGAFRAYRGIRSGRRKKDARTIPFAQWKDGKKETVWLEPSDLPDVLFFLQFMFDPFVLSGAENTSGGVMLPLVIPREGYDMTAHIGKPAGQFDPHLYACLMAKIAHGYATVRLGYGSFKPLTLERFPINRKRSRFNFGEQFHPIILNLRFNMIGYCSRFDTGPYNLLASGSRWPRHDSTARHWRLFSSP